MDGAEAHLRHMARKVGGDDVFAVDKITAGSERRLSDLKWPVFLNSRYNEALTKFMFSFKNIYSENINGGSAGCFITGPTKCGKSWYLRYNMRKFQNS